MSLNLPVVGNCKISKRWVFSYMIYEHASDTKLDANYYTHTIDSKVFQLCNKINTSCEKNIIQMN